MSTKITWKNVIDTYVQILQECNVSENNLYNHNSDLYVGCRHVSIANKIVEKIGSPAIASKFIPNKDSDMAKYPIAVEINFAYHAKPRPDKIAIMCYNTCSIHIMDYIPIDEDAQPEDFVVSKGFKLNEVDYMIGDQIKIHK